MNKKQKTTIITTLIGGICTIIATVVGAYIGKENTVKEITYQVTNNVNIDSIDELITEYKQMSNDLSELKGKNLELESENKSLVNENNNLKEENEFLKIGTPEFSSLVEENYSLLEENNLLKSQIAEMQILNENKLENETQNESDSSFSNIQAGKKVSIFDMDTFQGKRGWEIPESETEYTDTYNNVYKTARKAEHSQSAPDELYHVPTYLLNYEYSECEGQIAWPKKSKDASGEIWIDFYSNGKLIFSTNHISATDKSITFNFSVKDLEMLTVVRNSNRPDTTPTIYVIYPYLNLVE